MFLNILLIIGACLSCSSAVIYNLNDTAYKKMPPIYHLDDYEACTRCADWVYCSVDMELVGDQTNELYTQIVEYSGQTLKHFNYTKLQYGVCVKESCNEFVKGYNDLLDLKQVLEVCQNASFWEKYQLKIKVLDNFICSSWNKINHLDINEILIIAVFSLIFVLNIVGSVYEFWIIYKLKKSGNKFILSFSIVHNLKRLLSKNSASDERKNSLNGFHGVRAITMAFIILAHFSAVSTYILSVDNPRLVEKLYDSVMSHMMCNGTLVVQIFFIMSSFLLAYHMLIYRETKKITWTFIAKGILLRYIRLTPPYAAVLAIVATLLKFGQTGPKWPLVIGTEIEKCRKQWWRNLLYFNNYSKGSQCMPQTWYIAADMQLYILGLITCVLIKKQSIMKIVLALLFLAGLLIPALHTYFQDLDGYIIETPETLRSSFAEDATYEYVYKPGHTNLVCSVMGLALAHYVYSWQQNDFHIYKYKKYLLIYWATLPSMIGVTVMGSVFYIEGTKAPLYARVLYAALIKPLFGLTVLGIIFGMVFKYEKFYRGILEWSGWQPLSRLTYSVYLVHLVVIRTFGANHTTGNDTKYDMFVYFFGLVVTSHLAALVLWLAIEAPTSNLVHLIFSAQGDKKTLNIQRYKNEGASKL